MKNLFITIFLICINCLAARAQAQVLGRDNFYFQLFKDFPESFYRMKIKNHKTGYTIFKKENLALQMESSEESYLYNISINYIDADSIKINCTNPRKLNAGLLQRNFIVPGTFNSFFSKIQSVDGKYIDQLIDAEVKRQKEIACKNSMENVSGPDKKYCKTNINSIDSTAQKMIDMYTGILNERVREKKEKAKNTEKNGESAAIKKNAPSLISSYSRDSINLANTPAIIAGAMNKINNDLLQKTCPSLVGNHIKDSIYQVYSPLDTSIVIVLPSTNYLQRRYYNRALRWRRLNKRLIFGISGALASNYRQVLLNNFQSDKLDNLNQRNANEIAQLSTPIGIYLGYAWGSHQLMVNTNYQTFGFNIKPDSVTIDWETVYPNWI